MSVEYLKLKGFKSFGKLCEFFFSKNFTAIVGPNGSGKSNILDALKWILGEGALSSLRITKQSDLLFQGSVSIPQSKEAEVILKLSSDNSENKTSVLRRIYSQENGSVIFLDNKRILLQDLNSVKSDFSLDGGGFALIGQGEISQTINQKPKERRKQLDALFGIERYRERRNSSLEKLENAQNEASRIKTLITELETRRNEISPEVEIAVQAQGIIDELDDLRRDFYFFKRNSLENEEAKLDLQKYVLTTKFDKLNSWVNLWLKSEKNLEKNFTSNESITQNKITLENLNSQKNNIQRKAFQLSTNIISILKKRPEIQNEIQKLSSQNSDLKKEFTRLDSENNNLLNEINSKKNILYEREKLFNQSKIEFQKKLSRRNSIIDEISKTKFSRSRIESESKALSFALENNSLETNLLSSELDEKNKSLEILNSQKIEFEKKSSSLSEKLTSQNNIIQETKNSISKINTRIQNLHSEIDSNFYSGIYPEPVRILLNASEKNFINSSPVVAAETFSCSSQEIALAIESFLGARQFWLLVDTLEEAQEGINFLKNNRAGRVTYLALERCKIRDKDYKFKLPFNGVIGWATDLIKIKSHWEDAISHIMGDLLIVENYETASELVRQGAKFPIVTLEGEVFAPSGTVSGGSSRLKSGIIVARQRLEEINSKLFQLEKDLNLHNKKLNENLELENNLRNQLNNSLSELENIKSSINA